MLLTREYSRKPGSNAGDKKQAGIYAAGSLLHMHMADLTDRQHYCKYCSKEFKPERSTRRYCSDGCRIKMWYKRNGRSRRNRKGSSSGRKAKQKKQAE